MGNCLVLPARGWGIDRQARTKLQIPGGVPGGGMVTGRIEPCITLRRRKTCAIFLHNLHVLGSFQNLFWVILAGKLPDAAGGNTIYFSKVV